MFTNIAYVKNVLIDSFLVYLTRVVRLPFCPAVWLVLLSSISGIILRGCSYTRCTITRRICLFLIGANWHS
ncbi:unnamed protein product [Protopolystoma xenopodis]|uniref:Uncharacterized protein n=1 Tax=Protopolystoma xenopodis TaxID=117903 RepID=A0A3S5AAR0_9PLAT|nr:unnamed protein product [Protopolystoma xenopodis]